MNDKKVNLPKIFQLPKGHLDFYQDELALPAQIIAKVLRKYYSCFEWKKKEYALFYKPNKAMGSIYVLLQSTLNGTKREETHHNVKTIKMVLLHKLTLLDRSVPNGKILKL